MRSQLLCDMGQTSAFEEEAQLRRRLADGALWYARQQAAGAVRDVPKHSDDRDGQLNAGRDLPLQQSCVGGGGNDVDAEAAMPEFAQVLNLAHDELGRLTHRAEKAEAASSCHRMPL